MRAYACLALLLGVAAGQADMVVSPWIPIFKGIERAVGTNFADATIPRLQVVHCLRVDLTDPDVRLFPTPRASNYIAGSAETAALSISNFMRIHGLQVGSDANFYTTSQGTDPSTEGIPSDVHGLLVTTGQVVSAVGNNRYASLLFTTNNQPIVLFDNTPPGTNLAGIYNAISGFYPLVSNGVNIANAVAPSYPDSSIHQTQPRTAFGISQDKRFLFMMTIDGRQNGYSQGALDSETAIWLQQFGAWDGINMDGGGSTAMYSSDCAGNPVPLNHSSYIAGRNRERIIGGHFGVYALPLPSFIYGITNVPGSTTATINWTTQSNATSQVEYGVTTNYGKLSTLDAAAVTSHSVTLGGLNAGTRYYFRVLSQVGGIEYSSSCGVNYFTTTNFGAGSVFGLTRDWKYNTNNLDGVNWSSPAYDDSGWTNHGPGALWADTRGSSPNGSQIPNYFSGTVMPFNASNGYPYTTYYFRTAFVFSNDTAGVSLLFSNFIDDGAIFHLNGTEVYRVNMIAAPTSVGNGSNAISFICADAIASCPILFTVSGDLITNLVTGTNILAVEVHNYRNPSGGNPSPDVVFECALFYALPEPLPPIITNVVVVPGETNATLTWTTLTNSTSQVQYGLTAALGNSTVLDATPVTDHSVTLSGLQPNTLYYFRVLSSVGPSQFSSEGTFSTVSFYVPLVALTNTWRYATNVSGAVDPGANWTTAAYDDSGWPGEGPALLYIEDNPAVEPRNTPLEGVGGRPQITYYFRTHFNVSGLSPGLALVFSNYIDDGAVFYLNGAEIQRVRMSASNLVSSATLASECPPNDCEATLDVPDVFRISGDAMTNLVVGGDNVLAAEVHQFELADTDVVFGSSAALVRALASETRLQISRSSNGVCLSWEGQFLTLQRANALSGPGVWTDVPGPVKTSPYCIANPPATTFYRLRD